MLILTRRVQEALIIGGDIKVVVLKIEGDRVKIGIAARPDIPVYREELYVRGQEDQGQPKGR